jgi:hypothetical protein
VDPFDHRASSMMPRLEDRPHRSMNRYAAEAAAGDFRESKLARFSLADPRVVLLAIMALAVVVRIVAWAVDPDMWLDEAMLYQALKAQTTLAPWVPLGEYTQATPIVPALLWKALITEFGLNELLLRLPALTSSIAGLWVLWLTVRTRLRTTGASAALLLVAFSATAIVQAAQLKPYSFEFLASALILHVASQLADAPEATRAPIYFTGISIVALAFTYTAPVVTVACTLGLVMSLALSRRLDGWRLRRLVSYGLVWALAVAAWQQLVVAPSTELQFAGNSRSYDWEFLILTRPETWHHIGRVLNVLDAPLPVPILAKIMTLVAVGAWAIGMALGWRRRIFEHGVCFGALACLAVLSIAGLYPFAEPRKSLFLLPIFALSFGTATEDLIAQLRSGRAAQGSSMVFLLIAALLFPASLQAAIKSGEEQVGELIAAVPPGVCSEIWAYYLAWPAVDTYRYRRPDLTFLGAIPTASSVPSWSWRVYDMFPDYVNSLVKLADRNQGLCLLFSHVVGEEQEQEKKVLLTAVASHNCADWIQTPGAKLYRCN